MSPGLYVAVIRARIQNPRRSSTSNGGLYEPIGAEALKMDRCRSPIFSSPRAETQEACLMAGMQGNAQGRVWAGNRRFPGCVS